MPPHTHTEAQVNPFLSEPQLAKLKEIIPQRHSVRSYQHKPLSAEAIQALKLETERCCHSTPLRMQLVTNEPTAFKGIASYGMFQGVENYLIIYKPKNDDHDEQVGYYGERFVLAAQLLGLNTCWVGLTYKKVSAIFSIPSNYKVACLITLGYGTTQGAPHKKKSVEELSNCAPTSPQWFRQGVEAARLAPSAVNQQKFYFKLTNRLSPNNLPIVEAKRSFSLIGYTQIDLGIAKLHFELAAGTNHFQWG